MVLPGKHDHQGAAGTCFRTWTVQGGLQTALLLALAWSS